MTSYLHQLSTSLLPTTSVHDLLSRCLKEDGCAEGDITSTSIVPKDAVGSFAINVRGKGTIAGIDPIARGIDVFGDLRMEQTLHDGEAASNDTIALLSGSLRSILLAERTILNILGHTSGIATQTRQFVDRVSQTSCVVCDTRKTTPGLRMLDKYAVACGGGTLHRLGLHDAALYKDNHLVGLQQFSSQLSEAIEIARSDRQLQFVEVEVDTLQQLEQVLLLKVDIVLLDNMQLSFLREAVALRDASKNKPLLEASGGVTLETVLPIAQTGVDRIAIGGLTHQAQWLDIGLDAINE